MGEQADIPVLRRKVGARRAAQGLAEMSPAKALRLALAKAGDTKLGVPILLRELKIGRVTPDTLVGAVPDPGLILRLEDAAGSVGLAVFCPQAVAAATEAQTMGKVLSAPAPDRRPTATDALLMSDFLDYLLNGFALLAVDCAGLPPLEGYGFAGRMIDARVSAMVIEDEAHAHLSAEIDFAGGAKTGALHLVLPMRARAPEAEQRDAGWSAALETAVLGSPARLEAVLCRFRLPLASVTRFEVGQVVPLAGAGVDTVELRAANGRLLVPGRLGRSGPMRALRLRIGGAAAAPRPMAQDFGLSRSIAAATPAGTGALGGLPDPGLPDLPAAMADADLPGLPDLPGAMAEDDLPDLSGPAPLEAGELPGLDPLPLSLDLD